MHALVVSILGLGLLSPTAAVSTSPIPGYTVEEVTWKVQATPGGPYLVIKGTVQDVFSQLRQVNPGFEVDFGINLGNSNRGKLREPALATASSARVLYDVESHVCFIAATLNADENVIMEEGVPYLRSVPGQPEASLGPGVCGQVSCSWDSAIWWCIDRVAEKQLDSFGAIADGAEYIAGNCQSCIGGPGCEVYTQGQVYYTDGWSVVVKGEDC